MVEACLECGEVECAIMYNSIERTASESWNVNCDDEVLDNEDAWNQSAIDLAHKEWMSLNNHEGAAILKAAVMRHLYKQKFGGQAMTTAFDLYESYNPLPCEVSSCCLNINALFGLSCKTELYLTTNVQY